ncbi:MAG: adenosylcobinamide-GDP ribazoletransferase [Rhodococcus sp.]|uniref:adenosylcobinamide-GDP ribazoletransferase n=1 Tax=Rhodococcus TaxID=1827 RepID=UPI0016AE32E1|nr:MULTISPECIES: adenosylcobinamide-GDP ribazoletransferase [Rhodococcus]NLV78620.1 adenosylcobinamide-GDP ribazoletransferase [Rhodococcus sp. (in: high G+C Gram-positive bacteria)]
MLRAAATGVTLAASWLTVLPVRGPDTVDRDAGRRAIAAAPVAGVLLGVGATAVAWASSAVGVPGLVTGLLCVGFLAVATRGMHVDGLSDTADGLGCYGDPDRARTVMHSGGAGPFGVVALLVVLGLQAASFGVLADARWWPAIGVVVAVGRVAVVLACRRGISPAEGSGFGTLVAGTQGPLLIAGWALVAAAAAWWWLPGPWWLGPAAVVGVLAAGALFVRHCVHRFGGLGGDVLGAVLEGTVAALAVVAATAL